VSIYGVDFRARLDAVRSLTSVAGMDLGIRGKRAAVAAGSAGLGLGTARALAAEGVHVAICGRDRGRLDAALDSLTEHSVGIEADLSRPESAAQFIADAAERLDGPLDIVVANNGGPAPGQPSATSLDDYRHALELNCVASIAMCNEAVTAMRAQGWGRLLAITSIGARQPVQFLAASTIARSAVTSYIKTLSQEVAADGVTANTIQPGSHDTDRIRQLAGPQADALRADIPTGTFGDPDDFGSAAAFLCSQQAAFINGAALIVDGGASRGLQ
jgi:3-oxoacyl-[acyl-carrier protein] reductase